MMAVTEICVTPTGLAAFLEGSLTGEERDRMVRHLNHCPDCFERYIGAARLLDAIEEEEASALSAADVNVVAQNLFGYQNHLWGKWRPSAEARRLGPEAVQLDRLLSRDGYSLREASEILRTNHHVGMSPQELTDLAAKLPPRNLHRRIEGEEELQSQLSPEMTPAELAVARESAEKRRRVQGLLLEALATLSPEDRLIAKMRVQFSVSEIARTLNLEQKPLYRRLEKIFASLRSTLERKGVSAEDIADIHLEHGSDKSGK
jgi:hypothetical protein